MPALAFGFGPKATKGNHVNGVSQAQKRKAVFSDEAEDDDDNDKNSFPTLIKPASKSKLKLKPIVDNSETASGRFEPLHKSSKLSEKQSVRGDTGASSHSTDATPSIPYSNLSAIRTAKLHDEAASKLDSTVYEYDTVYDTFHADKKKKKKSETAEELSGPKYMTSLLASAETRKRDQLRARDKLLQKERENEGDEYADKDKFVTGAYKKQQEEVRLIEEQERRKEEAEEEGRRKGGGMQAFNRGLLQKEEERQKAIANAMEEAKRKGTQDGSNAENLNSHDDKMDTDKQAQALNEKGAKIIINDDGEVVDKRQLLGAGLNVVPKKPSAIQPTSSSQYKSNSHLINSSSSSSRHSDSRTSQRERQTRMMERQIEQMTHQATLAAAQEQQAMEEKTKSKITVDAKLSARERFLQRKREKEEQDAAAAAEKKKEKDKS